MRMKLWTRLKMIFFMASSSCDDVDADDEWTDKSPSWMISP